MSNKYDDIKPDFSKGLLPVILQHYATGDVLMLGYMNEEAFEKTKEDERAWFFSRSKNRLWLKGESSEHYQYVKGMRLDCDQDTLLLTVDPAGPTCHNGTESCFDIPISFGLKAMEETINSRRASGDEKSYTNYLFKEGLDKITKKFGEEAFEVVIAAKNQDPAEVASEAADLIYHLGVLLAQSGVKVAEVEQVLWERHQKTNNLKKQRREVENF